MGTFGGIVSFAATLVSWGDSVPEATWTLVIGIALLLISGVIRSRRRSGVAAAEPAGAKATGEELAKEAVPA